MTRLSEITEFVAVVRGVDVNDIRGPRREAKVAHARQEAIWIAREITELSYPRISAYFYRDHSTAMHSVRMVARRMSDCPDYRGEMHAMKRTMISTLKPMFRGRDGAVFSSVRANSAA